MESLSELVIEFIKILDTVEQSYDGRNFHPTTINSCRVMDGVKLNEIITKMKVIISAHP